MKIANKNVIPEKTDRIKFVLSDKKNIPQSYQGLTGVLASDDHDYHGAGYCTFSSGATSSDVSGLPANYHIASGQTVPYDGLIHRIQIAPNTDDEYIKYVKTYHRGPKTGSQSDVSDTSVFNGSSYRSKVSGPYASDVDITSANASTSYGLPSGYQLVNSNNSFMFSSAASGSANFISIPVEPDKARGITVKYINETGQQLAIDSFSGGYNSTFAGADNYTDDKGSSHSVAAGDHIVSDNPYPNDYRVDLSKQSLSAILSDYQFNSDSQSITVPMIGKSNASQSASSPGNHSNAVNVTINEVNSDGSSIATSSSTVYLHGNIGSFVSLKPSDLLLSGGSYYDQSLKGCQVSPSTAAGSAYYLSGNNSDRTSDGTGTLYQASTAYSKDHPRMVPGSVVDTSSSMAHLTFTYKSNTVPGSITVKYLDDQTGKQVGSTDVISPASGTEGQTINVISSDSSLSAVNGKSAKGENIQSGYTLADENMPNTIYTVNSHPQTVILYVHNNNPQSLVTNSGQSDHMKYPLTINLVEQLYINGQSNHSDDSDGWTNGRKVVQAPVQHISGDLNRQAILRSPAYTPTESNSTVVPASDGSYIIQFNKDGQSLNVLGSDGKVDNDVTTNNVYSMITSGRQEGQIQTNGQTGIVFKYNVYAKGTTQYRNRIHYVSYSDMDNEADITKLFNYPSDKSNFWTTVSDSGKNGSSFDDSPYRANVPKGYQFYKVLKVSSDSDNYQDPSRIVDGHKLISDGRENVTNGLTTFGKSKDQDEYIEVIPNASSINVHYVDQNGQQIAEHTFSGQYSSEQMSDKHGHGHTSKFGQFVPGTGSDSIKKNSDIDLTSPEAQYELEIQPYHTADGKVSHDSTFMFGRQPQDVKVMVIGKSETAAPLTVKYINRAGALVGYQSFVGRYNDAVNVVGDHDQNVPSNYSLNSNQVTNYHFGKDPQTVYLDVTGQRVTHDVMIERVMKQSDGKQKVSDLKPITFSGNQGSDIEINPNDYTPSDYAPDYDHDSVQFITMNATKGAMPDKIVFYYDAQKTNAAPIVLRYINQVGHVVGKAQILNGDIGDKITVNNGNNGKVQFASTNQGTEDEKIDSIPDGYGLGNNNLSSISFTNSPQTLTVKVKGNFVNNQTFNMRVVTKSDGGTHSDSIPLTISGNVGSDFHISPYGFKVNNHVTKINGDSTASSFGIVKSGAFSIPAGYHATNSDSDFTGVIDPDGKLSSSDMTYTYQSNGQSTAPLDKVIVHYVTSNSDATDVNGKSVKSVKSDSVMIGKVQYYQIDQESDSGYDNQDKFDLTPYLDDLPESVAQFYDIDGSAVNMKNQPINNQWKFGESNIQQSRQDDNEKNTNNIQDVYIKIHQNNHDQPIVVD